MLVGEPRGAAPVHRVLLARLCRSLLVAVGQAALGQISEVVVAHGIAAVRVDEVAVADVFKALAIPSSHHVGLADQGRLVAVHPKDVAQVLVLRLRIGKVVVAEEAMGVHVLAGHETGPRGRADRVVGVGVGEVDARRGDAIEVGRLHVRVAPVAGAVRVVLIAHQPEDVGSGFHRVSLKKRISQSQSLDECTHISFGLCQLSDGQKGRSLLNFV